MKDIVDAINTYYHYKALAQTFDEMSDGLHENGETEECKECLKRAVKQAKLAIAVKEYILSKFKEELED